MAEPREGMRPLYTLLAVLAGLSPLLYFMASGFGPQWRDYHAHQRSAPLFIRGVERFQAGALAEAAALFEEGLRIHPADPDGHFNLALTWHALGEEERALQELEATVRLRPKHAGALNALGVARVEAGRLEEAERYFRRAVGADEHYAPSHENLGALLYQRGLTAEAVQALERAASLDPGSASAHARLGVALLSLQEPERARAHLERALALDPGNALARQNLSLLEGLAPPG